MPDASDYISQKNSDALVGGALFSAKNKVSTQAFQRALLKRVTGPQGSRGGGEDVVSYLYRTCNGCYSADPIPTGYPNLDGSFTYKQGGKMVIIPSSNVIKLTSTVNIVNFSGFIYYNPLTSGSTYNVTANGPIWVLPPGTFKSSVPDL